MDMAIGAKLPNLLILIKIEMMSRNILHKFISKEMILWKIKIKYLAKEIKMA